MKLFLEGHDYKYAVEQMLLTLFPEERPVYVSRRRELSDGGAALTLRRGERRFTAAAVLLWEGRRTVGMAHMAVKDFDDPFARDSALTRLVKTAFFRAAVKHTGEKPAWGSLTGIRPAKIVTKLMEAGATSDAARRTLERDYFVAPDRADLCVRCSLAAQRVKAETGVRDISLYVGIPFCPTRCAYCSFVSNSVEKSMHLVEPYLQALFREIDDAARRARDLGLTVRSVYFGGGTPTTLSAAQLAALLERLEEAFDLSRIREYTVEAGRPDTVDPEKLRVLKDHGVTRVSINPQTMRDEVLRTIGRSHLSGDILRAFEQARAAGFACINMDLIAGLPGDDPDGFCASLDKVLALGPENVTVHTLALKKGSRLRLEGRGDIPGEEQVAAMLDYSRARLPALGYEPYYLYRQKFMAGSFENVGWTKPGQACLYNIYIMEELHTILSLGAGGTTKLARPDLGRIERVFNPKYPKEYLERIENIMESKDAIRVYYGQAPR